MSDFSNSMSSPPRKIIRGRGRGIRSILSSTVEDAIKHDSVNSNLDEEMERFKLEITELKMENDGLNEENNMLKKRIDDLTSLVSLENISKYQQLKENSYMMQINLPTNPPTDDADFDCWLGNYTLTVKKYPSHPFFLNTVLFLPEQCTHRTTRILLAILSTATKSIDICSYRLSLNPLAKLIESLTAQGIRVRIIIDGEVLKDTVSLGTVVKTIINKELCPVRTLGESKESMMHNKFFIIDEKIVMTGSFNWTNKAADDNHENILISIDPAHVLPYVQQFQKLFDQARVDVKPHQLICLNDVSSHYKEL